MTIPTPSSPVLLSDGLSATTATGYGLVTGSVATVDTGATQPYVGYVVLNVNAINASAGPYILNILGNTNSGWTGTTQNLGTAQVSATGQVVIQFNTIYNLVSYRYIRLQIVVSGTSPTITVQSFVLPISSFSTLTTDQLTALLVQSLANFNNAVTNFEAWAGGTATGGPSSNGSYPLSDGQGNTLNQPCPAKLASLATSGALQPFLFTAFGSTSIPSAITQVKTSGYRTLGRGAATYIASSTGTKSAWVAQSADGRYWSLAEPFVMPTMFGAIADGNSHAASVYYATLSALQADYPFATSLSQEMDWIGWQAALNYGGKVNGGDQRYVYKLYNSTAASQLYPLMAVQGNVWVEGQNYRMDASSMTFQTNSTNLVTNYNFASSSGWQNATQYGSNIINASFGGGAATITDTTGATHFSQFGTQVTLSPGNYRAICTVGISKGASYATGDTQPPYGNIGFYSSGPGQVQILTNRTASTYDVTQAILNNPTTVFTQTIEVDFTLTATTTLWYTWTSGGYGNFSITNMQIVPWVANCAINLVRDGAPEHYPLPAPFGGCELVGPSISTGIRGVVFKSFLDTDGTLLSTKDMLITNFGTGISYEDGCYLIEHHNMCCIANGTGVAFYNAATNAGENIRWIGGQIFNNQVGINNQGAAEMHFYGTALDYNTQAVGANTGRLEFHGGRHEMNCPTVSTQPLYTCTATGRISFFGGQFIGASSIGGSPVPPIYVQDALSSVYFYGTEIYNFSSSAGVMASGNGIVRAYGWKNGGNPNLGLKMISRNLNMDVFGGMGGFETYTSNNITLPYNPKSINIPGAVYGPTSETVTDKWTTSEIQAVISTDYAHTGTHSMKITRAYGVGVAGQLVLAVPVLPGQDVWGEFYWLAPSNVGSGTAPAYTRGFWFQEVGQDAYNRPLWSDRSLFVFENDIQVPLAGNSQWQAYNFTTTYQSAQAPSWATHLVVVIDFGSVPVLPFYLDDWVANVF